MRKTNKFINILFSKSCTSCEFAHEHSGQWAKGEWGGRRFLLLVAPLLRHGEIIVSPLFVNELSPCGMLSTRKFVDEPVHIIFALILHKSNDWNLNSNYDSKKNSRTAPLSQQ